MQKHSWANTVKSLTKTRLVREGHCKVSFQERRIAYHTKYDTAYAWYHLRICHGVTLLVLLVCNG